MTAPEKTPPIPPGPTLFPSDLPAATVEHFMLAGRVSRVTETELVLADAFASAPMAGTATGVRPGDHAVVEVTREERRLTLVRIVEVHAVSPHAAPSATSTAPVPGAPTTSPALPNAASTSPTFPGAEVTRFVERGIGANLRDRARAFALTRTFFAARNFIEVDTPQLVPSPGLDVHLDAVETSAGFLITSPEYQMKRLLVAGVPRQFQIAHVFRQGEIGTRHNPEFTMLEWYRAFASVEDVMRDTEELVRDMVRAFAGQDRLPGEQSPIRIRPPFPRLTVAQAFSRFADIPHEETFRLAREDEETFFRILVDKVEPELAFAATPVFLTDYPIQQASLARPKPGDPRVCERFELYLRGVELCNGFGELTDPVEQRRRLLADQEARRALGKPVYPLDERFLAALAEGMPPAAGNALGLDRLIALCMGEHEIAEIMPFPAGVI